MNRMMAFGGALWMCAALFPALRAHSTGQGGDPRQARPGIRLDTSMFAPSTDCLACHNNLVAPTGEDVSIGAAWRGTIMANAARDPYVHASVRREMADHPSRAEDIEDECAACHMPAAHKVAHAAGRKAQFFSHLLSAHGSTPAVAQLATDGVSCAVCHQIAPDGLGTPQSFNGNFVVAAPLASGNRRAFGPSNPDSGRRRIMHSVTGFEQEQAPHIRESALCATCHTLITEALGPQGQVIGSFPEQMNYQEWRHSAFVDEQRGCQSCHLPQVAGPVRISSVLGDYRDSLARHTLLGGNAFMLRLMNRYRAELGIASTSAELEATARATVRQLEEDTATVDLARATLQPGTLAVDVVVRNVTGHKFPTGYPSRRAWLHLTVLDAEGRTLFESGRVSDTGLIVGNASDDGGARFEPHYEEITERDQVQIYESILGTPEGYPTTGLLQATQYLKDNRLLPRGFDKRTAAVEIGVFGAAVSDANFIGEGDRVRYRLPLEVSAPVTVEVELRFQPIGYRWAHNLAAYDAPEPRRFVSYYNTLGSSSSVVVARASRRVEP